MKATCTWGEGPDILVELGGTTLILYENPSDLKKRTHGIVKEGSLDLSLKEAKTFIYELQMAVLKVEELVAAYQEYVKTEGIIPK